MDISSIIPTIAAQLPHGHIPVYGDTPEARVFWMSLFVKGLKMNGRTARGLPYALMGDPGTAKTSIVGQLCRVAGIELHTIISSLRTPSDFLGLPVPDSVPRSDANARLLNVGENYLTCVKYAPAADFMRAATAKRSLVFFDEANCVQEDVMAAELRVVLERTVGELHLGENTRIALALNDPRDTSGATEFSLAMSNRIATIKWPVAGVSSWFAFMTGAQEAPTTHVVQVGANSVNVLDAEVQEGLVDYLWSRAYASALGAVSAFLNRNTPAFHRKPASPAEAVNGWASGRSWTFFTHALAGCLLYGFAPSSAEFRIALSGVVGEGGFREFLTYSSSLDLPSPVDVLEGRVVFTHNPARLDRSSAIISSCTALVLSTPGNQVWLDKLWEIIDAFTANQSTPDLVVESVRLLNAANRFGAHGATMRTMSKLGQISQATGIKIVE